MDPHKRSTPLIRFGHGKWIDPLAVREIKCVAPSGEYTNHRVLVMRNDSTTPCSFARREDAVIFADELAERVNKARIDFYKDPESKLSPS